jgi:DNA adenine methylase
MLAFSYYGGKYSHLKWLLPLLPDDCQTFVDVFGGSAAVILNRKPAPVDVYNDLNSDVVNFFRVLRTQPEELITQLELTPYSRQEFMESIETSDNLSDLERARRFYICVSQSVGSQSGHSKGAHQWSYRIGTSCRGMASGISAWLSKIEHLSAVVSRFQTIQIEQKPCVDIIQRYDSPETLFYCDPPYMESTRNSNTASYKHETDDLLHMELGHALNKIQGRVAVSGYDSFLYDVIYEGWHRFEAPVKSTTGHIGKSLGEARSKRQEIVWMNYAI